MRVAAIALLVAAPFLAHAQGQTIVMSNDNKFEPASITITAGTTVTWVNKATVPHTSTSGTGCKPDGKWTSGYVDPGKSFTHTFNEEGTFSFFCIPHCNMGMTGSITVKGGKNSGAPAKKKDDAVDEKKNTTEHNHTADNSMEHSNNGQAARSSGSTSPAASGVTISIANYSFQPGNITIPPGTKVTWANGSNTVHTSTSGTNCSNDGKWNSGNLEPGATFSQTFNDEGTFPYFCVPHCSMGMVGVVTVKKGAPIPQTGEAPQGTYGGKNKRPTPGFKTLDVINSPSTHVLKKGILDFSIYHRFDDLTGPSGGDQVLFGLDNMRDVRIALAYGLFKNVTIGFGRSKGDWFNTPYQVIKNLYDGSIRFAVLQQDTAKHVPVSLTLYANSVYSNMDRQFNGTEADFSHSADRFSHCGQIMVSRDFGQRITAQVMGTYVRRNWVNICANSPDELNMWAVGAAGRIALTQKMALIGEYYYVISDYHHNNPDHFFNPLAVGLEVNTGGHVFHINFSNSTGIIPNTYIPYTTESWRFHGVRFGFSITRKFNTRYKRK